MPTVAATLDNNTQIKAQFGCKMTLVWGNFGLDNWRVTCQKANDQGAESASKYRSALASEKIRSKALEAELSRKEKALAETAALLVLRGKAQAIWGDKEVE